MDPADIRSALVDEIKEGLILVASGHPVAVLSETFERLSACFQSLAICYLLEMADTSRYRDNLARSAFARRYFLSRSALAGNVDDRRLAISRTEAFFDALAAGHGLLAREIAILSIKDWRQDWEYVDDFLFYSFLHRTVADPSWLMRPESLVALQEFEVTVAGEPSSRLALMHALRLGDQEGFNTHLRSMMRDRDAQMQARKASLLEPDLAMFLHWPRSYVCVEGLALIAIAGALRIDVDLDIPLCPTLARLHLSTPSTDDIFAGLEHELNRSEN
jgi:hypothetical protein